MSFFHTTHMQHNFASLAEEIYRKQMCLVNQSNKPIYVPYL